MTFLPFRCSSLEYACKFTFLYIFSQRNSLKEVELGENFFDILDWRLDDHVTAGPDRIHARLF